MAHAQDIVGTIAILFLVVHVFDRVVSLRIIVKITSIDRDRKWKITFNQ